MIISSEIEEIPSPTHPLVLTIGNFDGVHLGHQAILKKLTQTASNIHGKSVVLSFSNHPSLILKPEYNTPLLCSTLHKQQLLEKEHVDFLVLQKFTKEFSQQSAEQFLKKIYSTIPFSHLILGHDATIGKDREGNKQKVNELAQSLGFMVEYISQVYSDGIPVSSTQIRRFVQVGQFSEAEKLLGRPFSIYGEIISGLGLGKKIGFHTANISVEGLCLPPLGIYAVKLKCNNQLLLGVANLGYAPTVRSDRIPVLEVHILDSQQDLYGCEVEVFFEQYLRPEKKFDNLDELSKQIALDVDQARQMLNRNAKKVVRPSRPETNV